MFTKLYAIAANTFAETIRQPIFAILTWTAVGLLVLNPTLAAFSLDSGSDIKIMKDVGMSTMLSFGLLLAAFSAAGVLAREIESFTVLTVISKPVSRPLFLFGKYLGVAGAMITAYYLMSLVFLMTVRHGVMETAADKYDQPVLVFSAITLGVSVAAAGFGNYTYGWNFPTTLFGWVIPLGTIGFLGALCFDKTWKLQEHYGGDKFGDMMQVFYAIMLGFLAIMILTAFAITFSTRVGQVMTLLLCAGVFVLGLLSDYWFGARVGEGLHYRVLYCIVPNFQFFWIGDAITQGIAVPFMQVVRVGVYTGLYLLGVLGLGIAMFQTREVG